MDRAVMIMIIILLYIFYTKCLLEEKACTRNQGLCVLVLPINIIVPFFQRDK